MRNDFIRATVHETKPGVYSGFEIHVANVADADRVFSIVKELYDTKGIAQKRTYGIDPPKKIAEGVFVEFNESMSADYGYPTFIKDSLLALREANIKIEEAKLFGFEYLDTSTRNELVDEARLKIH